MSVRYPVKIVSDLHYQMVGGRARNIDYVRFLVAGAKTIVFNGDTVEQHGKGSIEARRQLDEIRIACVDFGVRPIFLRGNHDPDAGSEYLMISHRRRVIRIEHGDFGTPQLESSELPAYKRPFGYAWYFFKTLGAARVYLCQPQLALKRYSDDDVIVLGHTHFRGVYRRGRQVVVNLGSHSRPFRSAHIWIENEDADIEYFGESRIVL